MCVCSVGQLEKTGCPFPPWELQGLNSGHRAWRQVPSPAEGPSGPGSMSMCCWNNCGSELLYCWWVWRVHGECLSFISSTFYCVVWKCNKRVTPDYMDRGTKNGWKCFFLFFFKRCYATTVIKPPNKAWISVEQWKAHFDWLGTQYIDQPAWLQIHRDPLALSLKYTLCPAGLFFFKVCKKNTRWSVGQLAYKRIYMDGCEDWV